MHCLKCLAYIEDNAGFCPVCNSVVGSVTKAEPTDLEPGTELNNRYIVGQAIAHTEQVRVYKAYDKVQDTTVAIKELFPTKLFVRLSDGANTMTLDEASQEEFSKMQNRFFNSVINLKELSGFAVARVYELFEENGTSYASMEYIEGESLANYVKTLGGPIWDHELAMRIINGIGRTVEVLHSRKIVHRDITPDNIWLSVRPLLDVKLLGFNCANFNGDDVPASDIVVKPGFSPYEQHTVSGDTSVVDERSDIYSLGATMYYMIVGESPASAQIRFDSDTVKAPHDINPSVPVNISDAVMKAISIDKEYRYASVSEFLNELESGVKAISTKKEKKVKKEKKEKAPKEKSSGNGKKIGRIVAIVAACLLVVGLIFGAIMLIRNLAGGKLKDAEISIWYMAEEGSDKQEAMENIVESFNDKYPNIEVELRAIAPDDYIDVLQAAYDDDELPTLFESSILPQDIIDECVDLDSVLTSSEAKKCLFLDQFEECYADNKQIPLGVDIPFACVITNGNSSTNYRDDYFSDVNDFASDSNVAIDKNSEFIAVQNFRVSDLASETEFLSSSNTSSVLITSTMEENRIREAIPDFDYEYVFYSEDEIYCMFVDEWSVSDAEEEQVAAAERFIAWMLGSESQTELYVDNETSGAFPVCEEAFLDKIDSDSSYEPIAEIYENFVLVQYDPEAAGTGIYISDKTGEYIAKLYQEVYGRVAYDVEIEYVASIVNGGSVSITNYADYMIRSYECTSRNLSNEDFVRMIYRVFFNREADDDGLEYQVNRLESGLSRNSLLKEFEHNSEWLQYCESLGFAINCDSDITPDTPQGEFIYDLFISCLNRMPDAAAYEFYVNSAMVQPAEEIVRAFTIDSEECINRNLSDADFVRMAYSVVLGRTASEAEVNAACNAIANGTPRETLLQNMFNSEEWHNRVVRDGLVEV